jgi:ABC-type nitrate/sulfonate/bicarbonate transport system ATPase subunit
MIAGFDRPDGGEILTEGVPVTGPSPERVMLFQDLALFPWLTVEGNVRFGLERLDLAPGETERRIDKYLGLVGLRENRRSLIHQLSGGMKQRVALARGLAMEPKFLLMDEPFSSLDSHTRERLQGELQELWEQTWCTFVFVTHGLKEAVALGDRVVLLTARPGRISREILVGLPRPRSVDDAPVLKIAKELRAGIASWVDPVTRNEESL